MSGSGEISGWILELKVIPNASRNEVVGWEQEVLKIKLQAVPEDGKANKALIRFLSKQSGQSRSAFVLQSGEKSRHKKVQVTGIDRAGLFGRLGVSVSSQSESGARR